MSEDKNFEIREDELDETVGGKQIRRANGPQQADRRTRRAGGQRGDHIRPAGDVEINDA